MAQLVADRIKDELREPFSLPGGEVYITASVGVAFNTPAATDPKTLCETLMSIRTEPRTGSRAGKALLIVPEPTAHSRTNRLLIT